MKISKILSLLLALMLSLTVVSILSSCSEKEDAVFTSSTSGETTDVTSDSEENGNAENETSDAGDVIKVEIDVADYGVIALDLYPNIAPITVENFVKLANDGFYDGLIFHRVIEMFMIQGGDPLGNGTGGSGETIKGEFAKNGFDNPLSHTKGVISMARATPYDSASSQFFICQTNCPFLDGQYAAFGMVTSGIEIVDAIAKVETNSADKPLVDVVINSIKVVG